MCRSLSIVGESFFELKGEDHVCHRLLHLIPAGDFEGFDVQFGSKFIMEKLHERAANELDTFLLQALSKSQRTLTAGLARQGFECLAHRLLAKGGEFQVRPLVKSQQAVSFRLGFPPRDDKLFIHIRDVTRDSLPWDMYGCMPDSYPAVDGMMWAKNDKTELDLFQMTVSPRHGMSVPNLSHVFEIMDIDAQQAKLYWVVPSDMFGDFPVQSWKNADGSTRQTGLPSNLRELQQFVLAIPVGTEP